MLLQKERRGARKKKIHRLACLLEIESRGVNPPESLYVLRQIALEMGAGLAQTNGRSAGTAGRPRPTLRRRHGADAIR